VISNGENTLICKEKGGLKRCGGQGDVLGGTLATFMAWKVCYQQRLWDHDGKLSDDELSALGSFGACSVTRWCSRSAFEKKGRATLATDLVERVGDAYRALFETESKL
jgi:ATP-dependent NAD(P)H-hydrate dehydratase